MTGNCAVCTVVDLLMNKPRHSGGRLLPTRMTQLTAKCLVDSGRRCVRHSKDAHLLLTSLRRPSSRQGEVIENTFILSKLPLPLTPLEGTLNLLQGLVSV